MGTHPIFESDFDCLTDFEKMSSAVEETPSVSSQESDTGISKDLKELAVEDKEKEEKVEEKPKRESSKRKRTSRGTESPAKKPKYKSSLLSKSSSMSSLASNGVRPRGRPRRSLNPVTKVPEKPVAEAFKLETQP